MNGRNNNVMNIKYFWYVSNVLGVVEDIKEVEVIVYVFGEVIIE